jgi:hypothetical protein
LTIADCLAQLLELLRYGFAGAEQRADPLRRGPADREEDREARRPACQRDVAAVLAQQPEQDADRGGLASAAKPVCSACPEAAQKILALARRA